MTTYCSHHGLGAGLGCTTVGGTVVGWVATFCGAAACGGTAARGGVAISGGAGAA
jgi:hypothetical protein